MKPLYFGSLGLILLSLTIHGSAHAQQGNNPFAPLGPEHFLNRPFDPSIFGLGQPAAKPEHLRIANASGAGFKHQLNAHFKAVANTPGLYSLHAVYWDCGGVIGFMGSNKLTLKIGSDPIYVEAQTGNVTQSGSIIGSWDFSGSIRFSRPIFVFEETDQFGLLKPHLKKDRLIKKSAQ